MPTRKVLFFVTVVSLLLVQAAAFAADAPACPCFPNSHVWVAEDPVSWNAAAAAMVIAGGDDGLMMVPTGSQSMKWILLRRLTGDAVVVIPDGHFKVEAFDSTATASAHFAAIDQSFAPMMMTMADGSILVISLRAAEHRRPASH